MVLIKSIATKVYDLRLYEVHGQYQIVCYPPTVEEPYETAPIVSELLADYKTADFLFDLKYIELEGN